MDESEAMFDKAIASAIVLVTCLSYGDRIHNIHVSSVIIMTDNITKIATMQCCESIYNWFVTPADVPDVGGARSLYFDSNSRAKSEEEKEAGGQEDADKERLVSL